MIVVSNTSPLNYLALIDLTELLPTIFGHVLVPDAVLQELRSPAAPAKVLAWINSSPVWLESRSVVVPHDLKSLGPGEQEAIALAGSLSNSLVLLDEKKAPSGAPTRAPGGGYIGRARHGCEAWVGRSVQRVGQAQTDEFSRAFATPAGPAHAEEIVRRGSRYERGCKLFVWLAAVCGLTPKIETTR